MTWGPDRLENNFAEKGLGALMDNILNMSQQCAFAANAAKSIEGCIS